MNTIVKTLALVALSCPQVAFADPTGCDAGEEKLVFSVVTALSGHPKGETAVGFADYINSELEGRYCVEVYGNAELFDDNEELFQAMLDGEVHFAAPSFAKITQYSDKADIFNLPFLFDGPLHVLEFLQSDEIEQIGADLEDDGFAAIGYISNGMRQFSASIPMRRPDDADGLKFRVSSSSRITAQVLDIMGVEPLKLAFSKVYENLEDGTVQGQENTFANIDKMGFYQVQASVVETNHTYLGYPMMTSQEFLESLDAETRAVIVNGAKLITHERNRFAFELNQISRQNIIDDDGVVVRLAPQEVEAWQAALAPVIDRFKPSIGADFVDAAIRINKEANPYD